MKKAKKAKKKVCKLANASLLCLLASLACFSGGIFIVERLAPKASNISDSIAVIGIILLLASPLLAVASLIRINYKNGTLAGRKRAGLSLVPPLIFIFLATIMPMMGSVHHLAQRLVCATNLKGLGTAFIVYANDYSDMFPTAENWCDLLYNEADVSPKSFLCKSSDSVHGESDYCLNKHAAGRNMSKMPDDMVLLFEAVFIPKEDEVREPIKNRKSFAKFPIFTGEEKVYLDRWNQVGGPELLDVWRHAENDERRRGCNILFVDGHSEFVKFPGLSELNWGGDGTEPFPTDFLKPEPATSSIAVYKIGLLTVYGFICFIATLKIFVKFHAYRYWIFILFFGLLSAGTGWIYGNIAQLTYDSIIIKSAGVFAGTTIGLLVGICFAAVMADCSDRIKQLDTFKGFVTSVGMATGILCLCLVHGVLMITNEEPSPAGMLIGLPFGILAGAILGAIAGAIVKKFYCQQIPIGNEDQE